MSSQHGQAAPREVAAGCAIGACRVGGDSELRLLAPGENGAIAGMPPGLGIRPIVADQTAAQMTRPRAIVAVFW